MVPLKDKLGSIDRIFSGQASPLMLNFLKVVAEHGRLGYLRDMRRELNDLVDEARGRVRVEVTAATAVDAALQTQLLQQFRDMLGREPEIVAATDPSLIGGLKVRVGDTVYDGSVAAQLKRLRTQFQDRAIGEIQRGRSKFEAE